MHRDELEGDGGIVRDVVIVAGVVGAVVRSCGVAARDGAAYL